MGKIVGAFASNFTGKVGNVVGRKNPSGEGYVVSSYQPNVFNPRTQDQMAVRNTFASASAIAQRFGKNRLIGLDGYQRGKKTLNWYQAFMSLNFKEGWTAGSDTAAWPYLSLVISRGGVEVPSIESISLEVADSRLEDVEVVVHSNLSETAEQRGILLVAAMVTPTGEFYVWHTWTRANTLDPITVRMGTPLPLIGSQYSGSNIYVWAVQRSRASENVSAAYADMEYQTESIVGTAERTSASYGYEYSNSVAGVEVLSM